MKNEHQFIPSRLRFQAWLNLDIIYLSKLKSLTSDKRLALLKCQILPRNLCVPYFRSSTEHCIQSGYTQRLFNRDLQIKNTLTKCCQMVRLESLQFFSTHFRTFLLMMIFLALFRCVRGRMQIMRAHSYRGEIGTCRGQIGTCRGQI